MIRGIQKDVAKASRMSPQFLNDILKGRCKCPVYKAPLLERKTGIDIRVWLYGGDTAIATAWFDFVSGKVTSRNQRRCEKVYHTSQGRITSNMIHTLSLSPILICKLIVDMHSFTDLKQIALAVLDNYEKHSGHSNSEPQTIIFNKGISNE